jgi:hypothetical protein
LRVDPGKMVFGDFYIDAVWRIHGGTRPSVPLPVEPPSRG